MVSGDNLLFSSSSFFGVEGSFGVFPGLLRGEIWACWKWEEGTGMDRDM
jgi:hypothetical protein